MPVYKLFIDLYYDDFGTYRNVYHSLKGVYVQFENMPIHQRKLIKNHFVLGFVPFGGNFDEFILPFISEMKKFERGKIMKVQGQDAWVIAGLGVVTSDLLQGNDMTGVLRHNAKKVAVLVQSLMNHLPIVIKMYQKYLDIIILSMTNLKRYYKKILSQQKNYFVQNMV